MTDHERVGLELGRNLDFRAVSQHHGGECGNFTLPRGHTAYEYFPNYTTV